MARRSSARAATGLKATAAERPVSGESSVRPFLRWIGGKQLLLPRLLPFLPSNVGDLRYLEPFLGAGSVFLALRPRRAILSDLNGHLIECYQAVRRNPLGVARQLRTHARVNSAGHYYKVRATYNGAVARSSAQAARFIYLNHTSYNGVFRVNKQGKYNVPFGRKPRPAFPTSSSLAVVGQALTGAAIRHCDFADVINDAAFGDFLYLDPPYPPLNGTSNFTHYTVDRFDTANQTRLRDTVLAAARRGATFLMTNADTPLIRHLYHDFNITSLSVTRWVSCKRTKHSVGELLITNYDVR